MARTLPTDGVSPCDFYAHTAPAKALGHFQWDLTGATVPAADAMVLLDLNDAGTASSGTIRGLYVDIDTSGTYTTGSKWIKGVEIDMNLTDSYWRYIVGLNIGWAITDGKNCSLNYGIYMYFDEVGSGSVAALIPIGIDRNTTSGEAAETWDCFARFVTHGDGVVTSAFILEGYPDISTNLFHFEHPVNPVVVASTGGSVTHKIRVKVEDISLYIPLYQT